MVSEDKREYNLRMDKREEQGREGTREFSSAGSRSDSWPGPFRSWHIDSMEWRMVRGRRRSWWRLLVPSLHSSRSALDV